jgi:hypothetical protein
MEKQSVSFSKHRCTSIRHSPGLGMNHAWPTGIEPHRYLRNLFAKPPRATVLADYDHLYLGAWSAPDLTRFIAISPYLSSR